MIIYITGKFDKIKSIERKIALIIVLTTIILMLFENIIGIKMYLIACIGAVLLVLTGVLSEKEALGAIHQPTIFLFAGVLTLSDAIKVTGVGDLVADYMIKMVGDTTNPYVMMAVFLRFRFCLHRLCRIWRH